LDFVL